MNDCRELVAALDRLKRNETQMSEEQKRQYADQLDALKQHIQSMALDTGRVWLFEGIRIARHEPYAMERIRSVLSENEIGDAERAALTVLFSCYDFGRYLDCLLPLRLKIFYLGYGPYWAKHCKAVPDEKGGTEFPYYNDIIDMFWIPKLRMWKRKDKWQITIMLPPTMEMINEAYATELKELEGNDGKQ